MYTNSCNVSQQTVDVHSKVYDYVTKEEYELYQAWGLSTSIDLHDCDPELMKDSKALEEYATTLCKLLDVKAWGPCRLYNFGTDPEVAGYSLVQLIETSLLSGHFANKTNRIFLDVFSCKYYDPLVAVEYSKTFFKAKDVTYKCMLRK
ncbi:MAG: S-adenosylmethionine decarboxylase [Candidatus Bathyarchaeum sp.]|nr:MAG: S-adenosylmethionine decarboxylase [Candidatus Bathyarchaeum sp.]